MIPLKLTVKNFLCYRDNTPTLDLESVHMACLCGDNGHGKSALLDAITFALWGSSRLGDRNHDDLIHKGQSDMLVELEFQSAGERYRVVRRRAQGRGRSQGRTNLEFFIRNSSGGWHGITGNTVRDTQDFIVERIRMDHETFVNTAFLRQGDADRFTTSKPADRKRILAEVLDLSYYDDLERRARETVNELRAETNRLEADIEIREREAAQKGVHEDARTKILREVADLEPRLAEAQRQLDSAARQVIELEGRRDDLREHTSRIPQLETRLREASKRSGMYRRMVEEDERLVSRRSEIESGYSELVQLQTEDDRLNRALNAMNEIRLRIAEHRQTIAVERERLVTYRNQLTQDIQSMQARASVIPQLQDALNQLNPKRQEVEQLRVHIDELGAREKQTLTKLDQMESRRAEYERLHAELNELETQILREKNRLEAELRTLSSSLANDIRPRAELLPGLLKERDALDEEARMLESLAERIRRDRERVSSVEQRLIILRDENERLREAMNDTRQKFDLLKSGALECPLCNQELDSHGHERLRAEYEEVGMRSKSDFQRNEAEIAALKKELEPLTKRITSNESEFQRASRRIQNRQGQLNAQIEDAKAAGKRAESLQSEIATLRAVLESESFLPEERAAARDRRESLDSVGFDQRALDELSREYRSIRDSMGSSQRQYDELRKQVEASEVSIRQKMNDAAQARDEIEPAQARLTPIVSALETDDFSHDARVQAQKLEAKVDELGYDPGRHQTVHDEIERLNVFVKLQQDLEAALSRIELNRAQLRQSESDERHLADEVSELKERIGLLSEEVERLPEAQARERQSRLDCDTLDKSLNGARVQLALAKRAVERCELMEREAAELGSERDNLIREGGLYQDLAIAFGRNGIQALIIEDALPQIENDANDLLTRLTENRMSLKLQLIDGRRLRNSDAMSEELSIDISDEMGTRAYETFSGGEAFRINFALRIALSRLLARRSGAPLPILFIDEGFGSQDATGQERLIEAIQSIRDDFDKIVVITHVEGIKEAFDTRIQVQKTDTGSTFQTVWA